MNKTLKSRAFEAVIDTTMPQGQQVRLARNILHPLTEVGLSDLRADVRTAYVAGHPRFRCPGCNEPLFVAQNPASPDTPRDGRGAHFKHYSNADAPPCPQRTAANLRDIGAVKFAGLGEGADHFNLKHMLAFCLSQDPNVTDIQIERQIRALDGSWRQPDVSFVLHGQAVAVDVQLAAASLSTILERGAFYAANKIRHIWITDTDNLDRLSQLAFRDIYLGMGGRIFALDADVAAACVEQSRIQLWELSIMPRLAPPLPLHNVWERDVVDQETILMDPAARKANGQKRYRQALASQVGQHFGAQRASMRSALAEGKELEWMRPEWTTIARQIKGRDIDTAITQGVGAVLAWLFAAEAYASCTEPTARPFALEAMLQATATVLTVRNAKDWAPLIETVCKMSPQVRAALTAGHRDQLNALLATTEGVTPTIRNHAQMLSVLFHWIGFQLLVKAPRFAPHIQRRSSH
ncbi:hypothetical protein JHL21_00320 [Devosia sp. WQ 349]|uniref:competence protein CoiA family protein n=1 Tax=Devosia sp. WQ 349K1 TaxID=2800329 RepID=UPI001908B953|nr:DUF6035 family protein [Devosia sp. WQ 349K1]MBK1792936.1 hypothetical protein [Devosia sp. WQ 349K1]